MIGGIISSVLEGTAKTGSKDSVEANKENTSRVADNVKTPELHGFGSGEQNKPVMTDNEETTSTVESKEDIEKTDEIGKKEPQKSGNLSNAVYKALNGENSLVSNLMNGTAQAGSQHVNFNQTSNSQPLANFATTSDETTKESLGADAELRKELENSSPIDLFAQIDSYLYKYKPEFQEAYAGTGKVNNNDNFGVMAQDLAQNPITAPAVKEDENGYLMLDGGRLSSINTAMISELCKKVQELESIVYGRG